MKNNEGYLPEVTVFPCGGLDTLNPSTLVDVHNTPSALNVTFNKGTVKKRKGYRTFGSSLNGTVMAIIPFEISQNVVKTVALTTTKEYVWSGTVWTDITATAGTRTGTTSDIVQWTTGTDINGTWLYFTNGKDTPRRWDGASANTEVISINAPGFTTCKALTVFQSSLILANLVGTSEPKTAIWSDTANFSEFLTGNADSQLIPEAEGEIEFIKNIGDRLAVYTRSSLYMMTYVGGDLVYTVEKIITNTRLLSPRAIVDIGPFHVYASEENTYMFSGSNQVEPMGDIIQAQYRSDLALDQAQNAVAFYDSIETQIFTVVPTIENNTVIYVNELLLTDYSQYRWGRLQFDDDPLCFGYYTKDTTLLWNSSEISGVPWSAMAMSWNDNAVKAKFPVLAFGSGSQVFLYDGLNYGDNGANVEAWIDTIDFTMPAGGLGTDYKVRTVYESELGRWLEVEIELRGSSVQVQYSIDKGNNYLPVSGSDQVGFVNGTQALTGDWVKYRFFIDTTSRTLRIRLYDNSASNWFERRWMKVWVQSGGAY